MNKKGSRNDCCSQGDQPPSQHPDHSTEIGRLNRISGQIEGVKRMIEERRYCPEIITQLKAVRSATHALEMRLLEVHLKSCVSNAFHGDSAKEQEEKILELIDLLRKS